MHNSSNYALELFDQFVSANTMRTVTANFKRICNLLDLDPSNFDNFYTKLKKGIIGDEKKVKNNWKALSIFNKLDKKAMNKIYLLNKSDEHKILKGSKCLVIGGGPCGLRTAIELQLLGADHVIIVEKRDRISRNNVVHLWPFVIHDLKELAGKKLYAKFCAGSIDHISIRQLQLVLLKVALILGCDYVDNVAFECICPSSIRNPKILNESLNSQNTDNCCHLNNFEENNSINNIGAFAHFKFNSASNYPPIVNKLNSYSFNILIGADGRRNTLTEYFPRKEFRGRLAIAITANFINNHSLAEAQVPEISGISFIYYQQLFKTLHEETGIDLENICYYKDDTHYFVMTAKKMSLLSRGVLIKDFQDTRTLLSPENINQAELLKYAEDAAKWTTGLNGLNFALNHYGEADVAMFDFTSMYAAENACRVKEIYFKNLPDKKFTDNSCGLNDENYKLQTGLLLTALVGDSLLEPFWPTGSGCGRGFLSSMDAAWLCRQWAIKCLDLNLANTSVNEFKIKENEEDILKVISERESVYRLLAQAKPENLNQNLNQYTINPVTRYPNLNAFTIMPNQCKHLLYSNLKRVQNKSNKQTLAEKRLRRITIACTPDTFSQTFLKNEIEELDEEVYLNSINDDEMVEQSKKNTTTNGFSNKTINLTNQTASGKNKFLNNQDISKQKLSGIHYLTNKHFMTPSAHNLASLEKSRNKEIENVIKHRKQREECSINIHDDFLGFTGEERFLKHIQKQTKPKAQWFSKIKTENSYEDQSYSNKRFVCYNNAFDQNTSQEELNNFANKVRSLESKFISEFNEEKYLRNGSSNKSADGVNVMLARLTLQNLFDPKKQEEKFKEEVKRKSFLEKDYKFIGKLNKNDWNVKLFDSPNKEIIIDRSNIKDFVKQVQARPKERLQIFKEKLQNIENILTNGNEENKTDRLSRKRLQKFEQRNNGKCGEWIEKLKNELNDKQKMTNLNNKNKFSNIKKKSNSDAEIIPEVNKLNNFNNFMNNRRNIEYIKYEKVSPIKNKEKYQFSKSENNSLNLNKKNELKSQSSCSSTESDFNLKYTHDNCARCHDKVLTIDKIIISGILFHRNCLTCKNCGVTLRYNEIRPSIEINRDKNKDFWDKKSGNFNCICVMCSQTIHTISSFEPKYHSDLKKNSDTSSYSIESNTYENKLKERMKWKEMFLLNAEQFSLKNINQNLINERVEYENSSYTNELYDDEEATKLLNLDAKNLWIEADKDSDKEKLSDSVDLQKDEDSSNTNSSFKNSLDKFENKIKNSSHKNSILNLKEIEKKIKEEPSDDESEDEEDEEDEETDEEESFSSDTTGADFNSDQFDLTEDTSKNNSKFDKQKILNENLQNDNLDNFFSSSIPEIIINNDDFKMAKNKTSDDEDDHTLNEVQDNIFTDTQANKEDVKIESQYSSNNKRNKEKLINLSHIPAKNYISNINEVDEFNELSFDEENSLSENINLLKNVKSNTKLNEIDSFKNNLNDKNYLKDDEDEDYESNDFTLMSSFSKNSNNKINKDSINKLNKNQLVDNVDNFNVQNNHNLNLNSTKLLNDSDKLSEICEPVLTKERYSKIPVLKDRIINEIVTKKPIYGGSFTEKVLKCKSSPSLYDSFLSFSSFPSSSSFLNKK